MHTLSRLQVPLSAKSSVVPAALDVVAEQRLRTGTYRYLRWYVRRMADPTTLIQLAQSMCPKTFSGRDKDWPEWTFQLKTYIGGHEQHNEHRHQHG